MARQYGPTGAAGTTSVLPGEDELLTIHEAAELLKVTPSTMTKWCREGTVRAYKFSKVWRISRASINRMFSGGEG